MNKCPCEHGDFGLTVRLEQIAADPNPVQLWKITTTNYFQINVAWLENNENTMEN